MSEESSVTENALPYIWKYFCVFLSFTFSCL